MRVAPAVGKQGFGTNTFWRGQTEVTGDCQEKARKDQRCCVHGMRFIFITICRGTRKTCMNLDEARISLHHIKRCFGAWRPLWFFTSLWLFCHLESLCGAREPIRKMRSTKRDSRPGYSFFLSFFFSAPHCKNKANHYSVLNYTKVIVSLCTECSTLVPTLTVVGDTAKNLVTQNWSYTSHQFGEVFSVWDAF